MNINVSAHRIELESTEVNSGEYNITPCEFTFTEEYEGLVKMAIFTTCDKAVKTTIINNECVIPSEVLENPGQVLLGVYGYESQDDELVLRYSPQPMAFIVKRGSYRDGNDPELPPQSEWERVLALINEAITETNNLNITIDKENNVTHVVLTKKDGTTEEVDIEDGKSLEFNWRGTELGVRVEGQSEYQYVNLKGDKGDAGAIKMQIVDTLPVTGQDDTIYLVPLEHPDIQGNNYAEYIWINNQWELLGKIGVQVDLTDYVKNTDYATTTKGGVIIVNSQYGTSMDAGQLTGASWTYSAYQSKGSNLIISKGTLENVITGKDLTTKAYVDSLVGDVETLLTTLDIGNGV